MHRAPHEAPQVPVARFDPVEYLAPSQVERVALPVNEELFDYLPLTGFSAGTWLLRLYIDDTGHLDEVQVVESTGTPQNTEELRAILAASRFLPAYTLAGLVKSQRMIEISFLPGPVLQVSGPAPVPSATER